MTFEILFVFLVPYSVLFIHIYILFMFSISCMFIIAVIVVILECKRRMTTLILHLHEN